MFYLYEIINIVNNSFYIGVTGGTIEKRFYQHCNNADTGKRSVLYNAMRKHGNHNFKISELASFATRPEVNLAEIATIQEYTAQNKDSII